MSAPTTAIPVDVAELETAIRHLAALRRPSASPGEREAARWLAGRLEAMGYEPHVESAPVHGGYWWPWGLLAGAGGVGGGLLAARARRAAAGALAAAALGLLWDDIDHRRRLFRRLLPSRPAWNVWCEAGDPAAERTVVVVGHHDAAHGGVIFDQTLLRVVAQRFPDWYARRTKFPMVVRAVMLGPVLALLAALTGWRGLGRGAAVAGALTGAAMADIGLRPAVPGANDNLSGSATVLGLARTLRERPVEGVRVVLLSTGAEESNSEGMQAWGRRWFAGLPRESTSVLCVDTVGSPTLLAPECEGMLVEHAYDPALKDLLSDAAAEAGIELVRGLRFNFATDAQIALHAGYRSCLLASINELRAPANYHSPADNADNCDYATVADAVRVADGFVRRIAET